MDAPSGVLAEIGREQPRGDDVAGVRLHRERQRGQGRLHERRIVVAEAALPIGREGIDNARSLRAVAVLAEGKDLSDVIRRAIGEKFLEESGNRAAPGPFQTPAHRRSYPRRRAPCDEMH